MAARPFIPYAVAGAAVALLSSAALVASLRPAAPVPAAGATPPAAGARSAPTLSATARLAYWREGKLWVSDLDGSLRRAIAATEDARRISLTRWAPDGSALAFVDRGVSLSVVGLDASEQVVDLPIDLRNAGYRIADLRWSPDSRRIAATLLRPGDGRADAFLVDLASAAPTWRRLTMLDDLFAGDWISPSAFLAYTAGGAIGVVDTSGANAIRLVSGVQGISPVLGPRGRVYYLVGDVPRLRDPARPYVTATRASVWSAEPDGTDAHRESRWTLDDVRLDGVLPDERYLVHVGFGRSAQALVADGVELVPADAGIVERVRVAGDGRIAYGFADERIVRVDLAKMSPTPSAAGAVSVFLDGVADGDVWFPPAALPAARPAAAAAAGPDASVVFALGTHLWRLADGVSTLLRPGPAGPASRRVPAATPRWSPSGDRLLLVEQAGPLSAPTTFVAYVLDRDGRAARVEGTQGAARSFAWSPEGDAFAVVVDRRGQGAGAAEDAQLEVRFFDRDLHVAAAPVGGSEVAWTAKGLLVLRSVEGRPEVARLEEPTAAPRTLLTRDALAADPRAADARSRPADSVLVSALDAARDGGYGSVRLQAIGLTSARSYVVVFAADGSPVHYLSAENVTDLAWSPAADLFGYTLDAGLPSERTSISTPDGLVEALQPGRFAGWSADGTWCYLTRTDGLYAFRLPGGDPVRIGAGGAPVTAAAR